MPPLGLSYHGAKDVAWHIAFSWSRTPPAEADRLRAHLARYATEKGTSFSVEVLSTAVEFMNSQRTADLIFMDIALPGINGTEAAEELRTLST